MDYYEDKMKLSFRQKVDRLSSKAYQHIEKNPIKYGVGVSSLVGLGIYNEHKKMKPTHKKLKKHLKKKGYV